MGRWRWLAILAVAVVLVVACDTGDDDDADDDSTADDDDDVQPTPREGVGPLLAGPDSPDYNEPLADLARDYERSFHVFSAAGMALNADIAVPLENEADRATIEQFLRETDGWDYESFAGRPVTEAVARWEKIAGLYAGVGIAADAYRYGVLRDQDYEPAEVDRARAYLLSSLEVLHIASAITGVEGVIARGLIRTDIPASTYATVPLFDGEGNPLPEEKNNGTWRDDNSGGLYPDWIWEDSCSRDQYIGWMAAYGAAWEVIADDETIADDVKQTLRQDARAIGRALIAVRPGGHDLEIWDADGRPTYHAYMNENNWDRVYLDWLPVKNGWYASMALGSVAALAYASGDQVLSDYIADELLARRRFAQIIQGNMAMTDMGLKTNYSNVNMGFQGLWLAIRYMPDPTVRRMLRTAMDRRLYHRRNRARQPIEIGYSLFDFMFAAAMADSSAYSEMLTPPDVNAVDQGVRTLAEFPRPPFWDYAVWNCDEEEMVSGDCILWDGTYVRVLGFVGRNGGLIADRPIPQIVRPPSNYRWRSGPYSPNGGGMGANMLPGVDFRYAYWLARWVR